MEDEEGALRGGGTTLKMGRLWGPRFCTRMIVASISFSI